MKAWRVNELGESRDVLELEEVEDLAPGLGQLLMSAAGLFEVA